MERGGFSSRGISLSDILISQFALSSKVFLRDLWKSIKNEFLDWGGGVERHSKGLEPYLPIHFRTFSETSFLLKECSDFLKCPFCGALILFKKLVAFLTNLPPLLLIRKKAFQLEKKFIFILYLYGRS